MGERETRSHSADLTLEQERVSRAQYDKCDTYVWRIYKQYERYNAQIGYAWMHVLYLLSLLPTYRATVLRFLAHRSLPVASRYYRTMLESVYLQKTWLSLPKSAECHLSWILNHSNRATYITTHTNVLTFCKNGLSNFSLEKVFEALFPHLRSDTTCGRTA